MKNSIYVIALSFLLIACDQTFTSGTGFTLPKGDAENGEVVFDDLQCIACHTLPGAADNDMQRSLVIPLDPARRKYSYDFLVTSIINPSKKISKQMPESITTFEGESKMRAYNDFITVTELIDLVEFLRGELHVAEPVYTVYPDLPFPQIPEPK